MSRTIQIKVKERLKIINGTVFQIVFFCNNKQQTYHQCINTKINLIYKYKNNYISVIDNNTNYFFNKRTTLIIDHKNIIKNKIAMQAPCGTSDWTEDERTEYFF